MAPTSIFRPYRRLRHWRGTDIITHDALVVVQH
jgi:hypothetical protein